MRSAGLEFLPKALCLMTVMKGALTSRTKWASSSFISMISVLRITSFGADLRLFGRAGWREQEGVMMREKLHSKLILFLRFYLFIFREREREGEREGEKYRCEWETSICCLLYSLPHQPGWTHNLGMCPWPGNKPSTFCFVGRCPTNRASSLEPRQWGPKSALGALWDCIFMPVENAVAHCYVSPWAEANWMYSSGPELTLDAAWHWQAFLGFT